MAENANWYFPVVGPTEYSGGSWMPNSLTHRGRTHAAIDIYARQGSPIVAPVSGTVGKVGYGDTGGFFFNITGDDGISYYFAHMAGETQFKAGQRIQQGMAFGAVGNTGSAKNTKHHVHFSMKRGGSSANPKPWLDGGFKIPEISFEAGIGAPQPYDQGYADQGSIDYVDPFDVVANAMADSDEFVPSNELTAESFLSSAMTQMSNLMAGGDRQDYTQVGVQNVNRSLIRPSVATDEGGSDGFDEG